MDSIKTLQPGHDAAALTISTDKAERIKLLISLLRQRLSREHPRFFLMAALTGSIAVGRLEYSPETIMGYLQPGFLPVVRRGFARLKGAVATNAGRGFFVELARQIDLPVDFLVAVRNVLRRVDQTECRAAALEIIFWAAELKRPLSPTEIIVFDLLSAEVESKGFIDRLPDNPEDLFPGANIYFASQSIID